MIPVRPREVNAACVLLLALPLLGLLSAAMSFLALDIATANAPQLVQDLADQGVADPQNVVNGGIDVMRAETVAQIVVKLLQAIALGVLILFVLRGSPAARIVVFVVAGLVTVGSLGIPVLFAIRDARLEHSAVKDGRIWLTEQDLLPGWYQVFTYTSLALSVTIAAAVVWLLTRPAANAYFSRVKPTPPTPPTPPPEPDRPLWRRLGSRWGLIVTVALSAPFVAMTISEDWVWIVHIVAPIDSVERSYDVVDIGVAALVFAGGAVLLALLVATGTLVTGRAATVVGFCALGVALALTADLLLLANATGHMRTAAAELAIGMHTAHPNASWVRFIAADHGVRNGLIALLLLGVAAAQIPRPELGPRIQAAIGCGLTLISLAVPWATVYSAGQPRERQYWLWSIGGGGVLMGLAGVLLVFSAAVALLKPRTHRVPRPELLITFLLAVTVLCGSALRDTDDAVENQLRQEPLYVHVGGSVFMLGFGALLVSVAVVRSWWRARKRPHPGDTDRLTGDAAANQGSSP